MKIWHEMLSTDQKERNVTCGVVKLQLSVKNNKDLILVIRI